MNLDIGLVWAGAVWLLVLMFGILVGILLLGLLFGWPLMWATISTEGSDAFDALSRSYAYTLQRPLYYLFYAMLAGVLGGLTWLVVLMFGEGVIQLCWWAADWAVFDEQRMSAIAAAADAGERPSSELVTPLGEFGAQVVGLANWSLRAVTYSFAYGYFWVCASAFYLLLRREVDHTETDEIYLDDDSYEYGLPPLKDDDAGVPDVANDTGHARTTDEPETDDETG